MNKYSQIALKAAKYVKEGLNPEEAWEKASCEIFEKGSNSQKKGCPKNAFIGLYGINTNSKNAQYAIKALNYLKDNKINDITTKELWDIVGVGISHNHQMNVVLALYKEGMI